jgi:hypothetical protein
LEPNAYFQSILGNIRNQVEFNIFMERGMRDLDVKVEEGDSSVAVHDAGSS